MFKLFVLGALAHQIAAGRVSWNQELTVTDALKSLGQRVTSGRSRRNAGAGAADRSQDDLDQ
jgi:beta-lactamase class A